MAIDYLANRKRLEEATRNLVAGRSPADELTGTLQNIQSRRGSLLDNLGSRIQDVSGIRPSFGQKIPQVQRQTEGLAARQKLNLQRQSYDRVFQTAFDQAQEAGLDVRSAMDYARRIADQQSEQAFTAGENEKARGQARKINQIRDVYSRIVSGLDEQYQPDFDYGSAITRALLGTGAAVGTSYYLNRGLANRVGRGSGITTGSYGDILNRSLQNRDSILPYARDFGVRNYAGRLR